MLRRALAVWWLGLFPGAVTPTAVSGQMSNWSECDLVAGTGDALTLGPPGAQVVRVQTPRAVCADGTRLQADSARVTETNRTVELWGNVRFTDGSVIMTAPQAIYFENGDRIWATGGVRLDAPSSGSMAEAPVLDYRQIGAFRAVDTLALSGGRTHSILRPRAGGGGGLGLRPGAPVDSVPATEPDVPPGERPAYDVLANYQLMAGEEHFHAWQDVVITRDSLVATADSAHMDQAEERLFLHGTATVSVEERTLSGQTITALLPGSELSEIVARVDAALDADEVDMQADAITLTLEEGEISRVIGLGPRPVSVEAVEASPDSAGAGAATDSAAVAADSTAAVGGGAVSGSNVGGVGILAPPDPTRTEEQAAATEEDPVDEEPAEDDEGVDTRPVASSSEFRVTGDSIDFLTPQGVFERMFVSGNGRLELLGRDSLNTDDTPQLIRSDWIESTDSIRVVFTTPEPDSLGVTGDPAMDRLEAFGAVRALYRMPPRGTAERPEIATDSLVTTTTGRLGGGAVSDTAAVPEPVAPGVNRPFSVHFIAEARTVILILEEGALRRLEIEGPAHALVLEPAGRGGRGGAGAPAGGARGRAGGGGPG